MVEIEPWANAISKPNGLMWGLRSLIQLVMFRGLQFAKVLYIMWASTCAISCEALRLQTTDSRTMKALHCWI